MESFSICCGGFLGFCLGSDAWAVLLRVWRIHLPEVPPGHVCIPRHSNSAWDLNLGRSFRKSCNTFVVSGLAAGFCLSAWFRCSLLPLHLNRWRCLLKPAMKILSMSCSGFFEFCLGSDAWAVLLRVWRIPLPEVPPGHVCIPRHSNPAWDLNHGYSFRKSCNTFVVSGLADGFCLAAGFRCFPLPLHLNQEMCFLKRCNGKFLNMLRWISWVLFRFRCLGCSAACLADTPARSASRAYLHSAAFQPMLESEPLA